MKTIKTQVNNIDYTINSYRQDDENYIIDYIDSDEILQLSIEVLIDYKHDMIRIKEILMDKNDIDNIQDFISKLYEYQIFINLFICNHIFKIHQKSHKQAILQG